MNIKLEFRCKNVSFQFLLILKKKVEKFYESTLLLYCFYCTIATPLLNYRAFRDAFVLGVRWIYTTFAERQV